MNNNLENQNTVNNLDNNNQNNINNMENNNQNVVNQDSLSDLFNNNQVQNSSTNDVSSNSSQVIQNNLDTSNVVSNDQNNSVQNPNNQTAVPSANNNKNNNKTIIIVVGAIFAVIVLALILSSIFGGTGSSKKQDADMLSDYYNNEDKILKEINKNYKIKDYEVNSGILIELDNDNKAIVNAEIKVEYYDDSNNISGLDNAYIFNIPEKSKGYTIVRHEDKNYSKYKISANLKYYSHLVDDYTNKVSIVSNNVVDDTYIFQLKNDSDVKLDNVEVGLFYYDSKNNIIDFSSTGLYDINSGDTVSEKMYIPYDDNYENIKYDKVELKVLSAMKNKDLKN